MKRINLLLCCCCSVLHRTLEVTYGKTITHDSAMQAGTFHCVNFKKHDISKEGGCLRVYIESLHEFSIDKHIHIIPLTLR